MFHTKCLFDHQTASESSFHTFRRFNWERLTIFVTFYNHQSNIQSNSVRNCHFYRICFIYCSFFFFKTKLKLKCFIPSQYEKSRPSSALLCSIIYLIYIPVQDVDNNSFGTSVTEGIEVFPELSFVISPKAACSVTDVWTGDGNTDQHIFKVVISDLYLKTFHDCFNIFLYHLFDCSFSRFLLSHSLFIKYISFPEALFTAVHIVTF